MISTDSGESRSRLSEVSKRANDLLHIPYLRGGIGVDGIDCFGCFLWLCARTGIEIKDPRYLERPDWRNFYRYFIRLDSFGDLQPLDMLWFPQHEQHVMTVLSKKWALEANETQGIVRLPLDLATRCAERVYRLKVLC